MAGAFEQHRMIREPVVEGLFYPSDAGELRQNLATLLSRSATITGSGFAIISPHASFSYSGHCSAAAFKSVAGRAARRVVVIGTVHRDHQERIILPESSAFRTPLGLAEVDTQTVDALLGTSTAIFKDDIPHLDEHCIEVQLPFIQYLFPNARIVPILMGTRSGRMVEVLRNAFEIEFADRLESTLFVVSANITDYVEESRSKRETGKVVDIILSGEWRRLLELASAGELSTPCAGCMATLLAFADKRGKAEVLMQSNSLEMNSDRANVVSYAAVTFGGAS